MIAIAIAIAIARAREIAIARARRRPPTRSPCQCAQRAAPSEAPSRMHVLEISLPVSVRLRVRLHASPAPPTCLNSACHGSVHVRLNWPPQEPDASAALLINLPGYATRFSVLPLQLLNWHLKRPRSVRMLWQTASPSRRQSASHRCTKAYNILKSCQSTAAVHLSGLALQLLPSSRLGSACEAEHRHGRAQATTVVRSGDHLQCDDAPPTGYTCCYHHRLLPPVADFNTDTVAPHMLPA